MRKILACTLISALVFGVTACGSFKSSNADKEMIEASVTENTTDTESAITPDGTENMKEANNNKSNSDSNILIAYFTWADNTHVDNPDSIDVDATTSASVLSPGNAAKIADWIKQRVGGDLFSITVKEPYSSDYDECLNRAAEEKAANARPELANYVENMEQYDVIFLGFPNWWYTVPMAIHTFLEEYDFSGKTVIPFCTHGTGGLASTIQNIKKDLPQDVTLLDPIGIYRPDVDSSHDEVNKWLDGMGYTEDYKVQSNEDNNIGKTIKLIINDKTYSAQLYNSPAADSLYDMLPLTLTFEDFNGIEKIAYLNDSLNTEGEPDGFQPAKGDLCLYAPWGNLSVFYQDFRYSEQLISLGHIEDGALNEMAGMDEDFSVVIDCETK